MAPRLPIHLLAWLRSRSPILGPLLCGAAALAQQGDRAGEAQVLLPADLQVPPAPTLSPAAAMASFELAAGFRLQLVAAEPLLGDPVTACFDARGHLWVVEMRGYMNDVDASNEHAPVGRIVVLRDDDGDGAMDQATVFLDQLVLPRAVLPLHGGALVVEPPNLYWCPDADGDGQADRKECLAGGFEAGLDNPEHSGNGLWWGLDHRIHLANDKRLWRWTPGGFVQEQGAGGGQWGIAMDDRGRHYFNYNEDWLRCDLIPGTAGLRLGARDSLPLHNHRVLQDRSIHPIRITPGVNRGYQPGRLVDYRLAIHTAVCSPHIYRGDALPGCDGQAFVCEPAAHAVRRIALQDLDGRMQGANVYADERREFLASTDERFRPVHLLTGPEGALYIVDMYRGVIQHKNFVTTFLRRQIEARGLEQPVGLGRIWRVLPADRELPAAPPLAGAPVVALVEAMAAANGARRDLALRELVQRQERAATPALRSALAGHARPGVRIGLLSALAGLGTLASEDLRQALRDHDAGVVAFALQQVAPFLATGDLVLWNQVEVLAAAPVPPTVGWHLAIALGDALRQQRAARWQQRNLRVLAQLVQTHGADPDLLTLVGLAAGRDLPILLQRLAAADNPSIAVVRQLARVCLRRRVPDEALALWQWASNAAPALAVAALEGAVAALPKPGARAGFLVFPSTPAPLAQLAASPLPALAGLANELLGAVELAGAPTTATPIALADDERRRYQQGQQLYQRHCAACHQLDGAGMAGLAPPLRESEWVTGNSERMLRIVLHGLKGKVEVAGIEWNLEMPGQGHLSDEDLAAATTFVRVAFANQSAVESAELARLRKAHRGRQEPWTAAELQTAERR